MYVHVAQHARSNADAGCDHGRGDKDCFVPGFLIQPEEKEACCERHSNTGNGDPEAQASHADQFAGRSFQTDREEQEYSTNLGDGVDGVAGQNKAGSVRTENHTCQDFAENCQGRSKRGSSSHLMKSLVMSCGAL